MILAGSIDPAVADEDSRSDCPYAPILAGLLPARRLRAWGCEPRAERFGSFEDWMIWPLAVALLWFLAGYFG